MLTDLRQEFAHVSRAELHYIYGANCYQHAIGFPSVLILLNPPDPRTEQRQIHYVGMTPGNLSHYEDLSAEQNPERIIIEECQREGIVRLNDFETREGFRTLALFTKRKFGRFEDFHFAFLDKDGNWEGKVMFEKPQTNDSIAAIEQDTRYKFYSYLLAPENLNPSLLQKLVFKTKTVSDAAGTVKLLVINPNKGQAVVRGEEIILYTDCDTAYHRRLHLEGLIPKMPC